MYTTTLTEKVREIAKREGIPFDKAAAAYSAEHPEEYAEERKKTTVYVGGGVPKYPEAQLDAEIKRQVEQIAKTEELNLNIVEEHIKALARVYECRPELYQYIKSR
jgi:hypothetical protein